MCGLAPALFPGVKVQAQSDNRPNIVFLLTDDQRFDAMSCAGNPIIRTPEMDKLAAQGLRFTNMFATTPISAASRASILTGMYERAHGFTFSTPPLAHEFINTSYPVQLRKSGYYTGYYGKLGVEMADKLDNTMFDRYETYGTLHYFFLTGAPTFNVHMYQTDFTGQQAVEFIREAPDDRPFCLTVGFNAPHAEDQSLDQYIFPERLDTFYESATIPPPPLSDPVYFERLPREVREGENRVRWHWRFDSPDKYQRMVKGYYRMITAIDQQIASIRKALEDKGVADNTVIIFCSDNGYFLGERGLAGKWLMYEESLRLPLIIFDPRQGPRGLNSRMVLNIDIAPTILDLAGIPIPAEMQGRSLVPYLKGDASQGRDMFLCEHLFNHLEIPQSEGVRTADWKYFRYRNITAPEELYYLPNDPRETLNLATVSGPADLYVAGYAEQLVRLRRTTDSLIAVNSFSVNEISSAEVEISQAEQVKLAPENWSGPADCAVKGRLCRTSGALLVSLDISDDQVMFADSGVKVSEQIELYFDFRPGRKRQGNLYEKGVFQLIIRPDAKGKHQITSFPAFYPSFVDARLYVQTGEGGYRLNVLLPFSSLQQVHYLPRETFFFDLGIHDTDQGNSSSLFWKGNSDNWQHPENFFPVSLPCTQERK